MSIAPGREAAGEIERLNWALAAYSRATSALLRGEGLSDLANGVCEAIVEHDAYVLAAVALAEPAPGKRVRFVAGAGLASAYMDDLDLSWDEGEAAGRGPTGQAMRSGKPHIMRDSLVDPIYAPWREKGLRFGIRSSTTIPFTDAGDLLGVLLVYSSQPDAFGPREMDLFQRLGEELAFAIRLRDERARLRASEAAERDAREAELAALRRAAESDALYRLIADKATDLILRYDLDGRIRYASPAVRQFGFTPEQVIGRNVAEFRHPDDAVPAAASDRGGATASVAFEARVRRADGQYVWLEGLPAPYQDDAGRTVGVVAVLRDVTARREMEEGLRLKRAEAEAAVLAKTEFLANMSHELRTPLTAIIGFAGLLEGTADLSPAARAYVNRIVRGGEALMAVVNDIFDYSTIEAGQILLDPGPFDPAAFIRETVDLERPHALGKGLDLRIETRGVLPAQVVADAARLGQVLMNLIANAIKFTPSGSVTVAAGYEPRQGGRLRVEVTDTGIGIAPEHMDRLFRRFSQVDSSIGREYGGSGLGLAICKGLVDMMGGEIGVDSRPGQGSTFWFWVPAEAAGASDPAAAHPPGRSQAMAPRLRILVVDDVDVNRELIVELLEPAAAEITEARNGVEAVNACFRARFDVILMDLQMPGLDGYDATRAIRANSELNAGTPILAISANVLPRHVDACREAGMDDHLAKPLSRADLLAMIAKYAPPAADRAPMDERHATQG